MSLTKLSLAWNNLIILGRESKLFHARESLVSDIPAGDGKIANLFLQCSQEDNREVLPYNSGLPVRSYTPTKPKKTKNTNKQKIAFAGQSRRWQC
jgi:hypothetical protein